MAQSAFTKGFMISGVDLTESDLDALSSLEANAIPVGKGQSILDEGAKTDLCGVLIEGWMLRQRTLPDGRRQIVDVLPAGSLFAMNALGVRLSDESLVMLTPGRISWFSQDELRRLLGSNPRALAAMLWAEAREAAIMSERILTLGQRSAIERMAHYFIEIGRRLRARGLDDADHFRLPLTQELLGDLLGMTSVHVNRTLKRLEKEGHIARRGDEIALKLSPKLYRLAGFQPHYLHEGDAVRQGGKPPKPETTMGGSPPGIRETSRRARTAI
ncbi:MAG: Crp/Fnr family transcriptional regulator [Rhodovibrionaceae bacterium]|nr:Crp/Fnr family transcriptional regulator [Rhodovibrionaceae bacterium]